MEEVQLPWDDDEAIAFDEAAREELDQHIKLHVYAEVAIAFAPFEVGERAQWPIELFLRHQRYLRRLDFDGPGGDLPAQD